MCIGPELLEIEGLFYKIVIESNETTTIYCKDKKLVVDALESYELSISENYVIIEEQNMYELLNMDGELIGCGSYSCLVLMAKVEGIINYLIILIVQERDYVEF